MRKGYFISSLIALALLPAQYLFAQAKKESSAAFSCRVEPYYKHRKDGKPGRAITVFSQSTPFKPQEVSVECEGKKEIFSFASSRDSLIVLLPDGVGVGTGATVEIMLRGGGRELRQIITISPSRHWTVFIYPHSHVDIGYTALQEEVEKLHVRNIDVGIDLAEKTKDYPEGSRFIWNPEATWVVDAYLKKATAQQKQHFIAAVKKGWLRIDAGHSNLNTSTSSDEELMQFFSNSNKIENLTGTPITTMVQMDVPGAAWGIVQAAAQNGVKGVISFPNYYDLRKLWEHRPFYWKSPDGKKRILFLQASPYGIGYTIKGSKYGLAKLQTYSANYDRVSTGEPLKNFIDPFIFEETAKLEMYHSPYDLFAMTWSMADNCVIDADLPEAVRQWNELYAFPHLQIAGAEEILAAYEKKYASIIPENSGDFTEFWTNGLGSDAAHVGMGRRAKENLVQAETIWAIIQPSRYPSGKIAAAWEQVLLSAEHTWGYQNPKEPLATVIEARKASFFAEAERQSNELLNALADPAAPASKFAVVNSLSWERDGIISLKPEQSRPGDRVIDLASGKSVPSQRLSTGFLIFKTNTIPALASAMYEVVGGPAYSSGPLNVFANTMSNDSIVVKLDTKTGAIASLTNRKTKYEFVSGEGLNAYYYIRGVFNGKDSALQPVGIDSVTISVKERGPLMVTLLVRSRAQGTFWMEREISLFADQKFVQIRNTFDKIGIFEKEGLHFGFAFNLPAGIARVDAPWSLIIPERDQLWGSNKNWMSFQRWVDISNNSNGITWTAIESPLIEWGEMSGTILDGARQGWLWKKKLLPTQTVYSWPLNNHWDTNFPLKQKGIEVQQYALLVHGAYDPVTANRFGTEQHRPLIVVPALSNLIDRSFVQLSNPKIAISGLKKTKDEKGILLRLRSFSDQEEELRLTWPGKQPRKIQRCTAEEKPLENVGNTITLPPFGTESLYLQMETVE